ncbi:hypothetical protein EMIT0111MI5_40190 [Burkholderia sp. IT-111MI5]
MRVGERAGICLSDGNPVTCSKRVVTLRPYNGHRLRGAGRKLCKERLAQTVDGVDFRRFTTRVQPRHILVVRDVDKLSVPARPHLQFIVSDNPVPIGDVEKYNLSQNQNKIKSRQIGGLLKIMNSVYFLE